MTLDIDRRRRRIVETARGRSGNPVLLAKGLGEGLRAFQSGGCRVWAEGVYALGIKAIDQASNQGRLWADDDEGDAFVTAERNNSIEIHGIDGDTASNLSDPAIAGRAQHFVAQGRGGDCPTQRMLATSRADHQNLHIVLHSLFATERIAAHGANAVNGRGSLRAAIIAL